MYKLLKLYDGANANVVFRIEDKSSIPFDPANTDYQAFKTALQTGKNADGTAVSLEDANGTAMTAEQMAAFVETLP